MTIPLVALVDLDPAVDGGRPSNPHILRVTGGAPPTTRKRSLCRPAPHLRFNGGWPRTLTGHGMAARSIRSWNT